MRAAEDQVDLLIVDVEELVDAGVLNGGQGNALISKLKRAIANIENDQYLVAVKVLKAFNHQVEDYLSEAILTEDQGAALIMYARSIIGGLNS